MTEKKPKLKLSPTHRQIIAAFVEERSTPFRRGDISDRLFKAVRPRTRSLSDAYADLAISELAESGRIQRHGHLHWVLVGKERQLLSGKKAPELEQQVELPITTRCPAKWLSVDLESGEIWTGTAKGWKRTSVPGLLELLKRGGGAAT